MSRPRCPWPKTEIARAYHDREWGVPLHDDRRLFELLALSGVQAGLSWQIILDKREAFRAALAGFEPQRLARFTSARIERLMTNPAIVRNRRKLEAAIHNARCVLSIQEEFDTFDAYLWRFVGGTAVVNRWRRSAEVPSKSPLSDQLSRDLTQRGFKFVGSTICYAFMQSVGMVNDHLIDCFRHKELTS